MGTSVEPETPPHLRYPPEKWEQIFQQASAGLRTNHQDADALEALKVSAEALNAYDAPAIEAGKHLTPTGWGDPLEAVKGEARGMVGAVKAPFHLAGTVMYKGTDAALDEIVNGLKAIPGEITSGDPARIGEVGGNIAGGIAMGRLGTKLGGATGSAVGNLLERPGLKNQLLKAQTESARLNVGKTGATMPDAIEQAGLKTDTMKQSLNQKSALQPHVTEQAGLKTEQMQQGLERGEQGLKLGEQDISRGEGSLGATTERPGLQNELTRLQIEMLMKRLQQMMDEGEGDAGPSGSAPVEPTPPGGAPNDVLKPLSPQEKSDFLSAHDTLLDSDRNPGVKPISPDDVNNALGKTPEQLRREANQQDFIDNTDPYGLDNMVKPTAPGDLLGNIINDLKNKQTAGDAPHDILGPNERFNGPKPLTPEQINQLLRDIGGGNMSK